MVEALISVVLSILILVVFSGPAWAIKLGSFGGLAFMIYVTILLVEFLVSKVPKRP